LTYPTKFSSHFELARLPWFEVRDGLLALSDPSLGPCVDVHTHLALTYLLPHRVDLAATTRRSELYLNPEEPLDLDIYANQHLSPALLRRMRRDLVWGSFVGARGPRATHTAGNLSREMGPLGVRHSVLLAIELPWISTNAEKWLEVVNGRKDFIVFGSVHPLEGGVAARLDRQKALGARGVKLHPAVQMMAPDHPKMVDACRLAGERGLPVLFHCGPVGIEPAAGRRRSQVDLYERAVAECPGTTFVLGHSGALQPELGIGLCQKYGNVWLEIASQGLPTVRRILDEADPARICLGSDWPFYHQAMALAKVFIATEGRDDLRRAVLYGNAARLLGLPT
jgi:predicted TIM-barrel fold metal-dependent hydrolase